MAGELAELHGVGQRRSRTVGSAGDTVVQLV